MKKKKQGSVRKWKWKIRLPRKALGEWGGVQRWSVSVGRGGMKGLRFKSVGHSARFSSDNGLTIFVGGRRDTGGKRKNTKG